MKSLLILISIIPEKRRFPPASTPHHGRRWSIFRVKMLQGALTLRSFASRLRGSSPFIPLGYQSTAVLIRTAAEAGAHSFPQQLALLKRQNAPIERQPREPFHIGPCPGAQERAATPGKRKKGMFSPTRRERAFKICSASTVKRSHALRGGQPRRKCSGLAMRSHPAVDPSEGRIYFLA